MIIHNGRIKCDGCGKFISYSNHVVVVVQDSYYTTETINDYDRKCVDYVSQKV